MYRGLRYREVVRQALARHVPSLPDEAFDPEANPNQWLLDLLDEIEQIVKEDGVPNVPRFPIDSPEARAQLARDRYRPKPGRDPNW